MPHFQLVTDDGENRGPIELRGFDWRPGLDHAPGCRAEPAVLEQPEDTEAENNSELFTILRRRGA
jgi:hypothetical protein